MFIIAENLLECFLEKLWRNRRHWTLNETGVNRSTATKNHFTPHKLWKKDFFKTARNRDTRRERGREREQAATCIESDIYIIMYFDCVTMFIYQLPLILWRLGPNETIDTATTAAAIIHTTTKSINKLINLWIVIIECRRSFEKGKYTLTRTHTHRVKPTDRQMETKRETHTEFSMSADGLCGCRVFFCIFRTANERTKLGWTGGWKKRTRHNRKTKIEWNIEFHFVYFIGYEFFTRMYVLNVSVLVSSLVSHPI